MKVRTLKKLEKKFAGLDTSPIDSRECEKRYPGSIDMLDRIGMYLDQDFMEFDEGVMFVDESLGLVAVWWAEDDQWSFANL